MLGSLESPIAVEAYNMINAVDTKVLVFAMIQTSNSEKRLELYLAEL